MNFSLDKSLARSLASESPAVSLTGVAGASLDAAIESGALDGIPAVGLVTGAIKSAGDIGVRLCVRKLAVFLQQVSSAPLENRERFAGKLESQQQQHRFGEATPLLLDRAENAADNDLGIVDLSSEDGVLLRTCGSS